VTPATARTPPNETWMSRSATSGTRAGAVTGVDGCGLIIVGSAHPSAEYGIEAYRHNENDPDDDVLGRRVHEQKHHAGA